MCCPSLSITMLPSWTVLSAVPGFPPVLTVTNHWISIYTLSSPNTNRRMSICTPDAKATFLSPDCRSAGFRFGIYKGVGADRHTGGQHPRGSHFIDVEDRLKRNVFAAGAVRHSSKPSVLATSPLSHGVNPVSCVLPDFQ